MLNDSNFFSFFIFRCDEATLCITTSRAGWSVITLHFGLLEGTSRFTGLMVRDHFAERMTLFQLAKMPSC